MLSDEARHVAFGVLTLAEYYENLTEAELLDRQEFMAENTIRNRSRSTTPEIWERMGMDFETALPALTEGAQKLDKSMFTTFQNGFFAKLVPEHP